MIFCMGVDFRREAEEEFVVGRQGGLGLVATPAPLEVTMDLLDTETMSKRRYEFRAIEKSSEPVYASLMRLQVASLAPSDHEALRMMRDEINNILEEQP